MTATCGQIAPKFSDQITAMDMRIHQMDALCSSARALGDTIHPHCESVGRLLVLVDIISEKAREISEAGERATHAAYAEVRGDV